MASAALRGQSHGHWQSGLGARSAAAPNGAHLPALFCCACPRLGVRVLGMHSSQQLAWVCDVCACRFDCMNGNHMHMPGNLNRCEEGLNADTKSLGP